MSMKSKKLILGGVLASTLFAGMASPVWAVEKNWTPRATETLVKLPAQYLNKAIERDYARSTLAGAINTADQHITNKRQTLQDLQSAADRAKGDVKAELQHQILVEKKTYIMMMGERQDLRRKHMRTKARLYQRMLTKLDRANQYNDTPEAQELAALQTAAKERFKLSIDKVDMDVFGSGLVEQSKYQTAYAKNQAAIDNLAAAISKHAMSAGPEVDGRPISKKELLQRLIADTEQSIALVDQEEMILGYMAKLVALDAMALAEGISADGLGDGKDGEFQSETTLAASVDLFVN